MMSSFAGRGIVSTFVDQSELGRLNMILGLYRSLTVLDAHPRVDPNRIAARIWGIAGVAPRLSDTALWGDG